MLIGHLLPISGATWHANSTAGAILSKHTYQFSFCDYEMYVYYKTSFVSTINIDVKYSIHTDQPKSIKNSTFFEFEDTFVIENILLSSWWWSRFFSVHPSCVPLLSIDYFGTVIVFRDFLSVLVSRRHKMKRANIHHGNT